MKCIQKEDAVTFIAYKKLKLKCYLVEGQGSKG
jgi:hypothetical protein